jgi:aspartate aminotransferase-like enzyme
MYCSIFLIIGHFYLMIFEKMTVGSLTHLLLIESRRHLKKGKRMARLFIPGPTDVDQRTLDAIRQPMISHRSEDFTEIFARIQSHLKHVLQTDNRVFVTSSSGTALFEGALRNTVAERVLICVCGAFGERWFDVARRNGLNVDRLDSKWGEPNLPDQVVAKLKSQEYDTLVIVHNETSTGVENPITEIITEARNLQPNILTIVDAVSSAGGADIRTDEIGIDVLVTSSQKCFALPPGLAFAAVSKYAMERAESISERGYYFDFLLLDKFLQRDMTLATPAISLFYALDVQLEIIRDEGLTERFNRHARLAEFVQTWAGEHFEPFAADGFRSKTLTTVRNTREIDVAHLNRYLSRHEMLIGNGYGKLKEKTFRIAHMGELRLDELKILLEHIEDFISSSD